MNNTVNNDSNLNHGTTAVTEAAQPTLTNTIWGQQFH